MDEPLTYIQEPPVQAPEPAPLLQLPTPKWWHRITPRMIVTLVACLFVGPLVFLGFAASAPSDFPVGTVFVVEKGETLSGAASTLHSEGFIRSPLLFKLLLTAFDGTRGLVAGDYYFVEKQGVVGTAWRLARGHYNLDSIRITIPEGFSSAEIAQRMSERFSEFDVEEFTRIASKYEGYLFPDTYLFLPNVHAEEVVKAMTDNYQRRIVTLEAEIRAFGKPIEDVITMASIIEEEARTEESRRMIAGILWKRLSIDMPLQVDAAFAFVNGKKASADLTLEDLKIESPYNTYVNRGLPPGPISNPGLDSIRATVTPIESKYFYYLTDNDGFMRYGETHDEHVANKNRYLR